MVGVASGKDSSRYYAHTHFKHPLIYIGVFYKLGFKEYPMSELAYSGCLSFRM